MALFRIYPEKDAFIWSEPTVGGLYGNAGKDEVFVMANASDKERLKAIKDMNDGESAYIHDERMAYVQKKGEVDRIKLPDVQRELSKQMIEQMKGRGRG